MSRTSAALTIVNALPTGVGCAIGIERFVTATADLESSSAPELIVSPPASATSLVQASVVAALAEVAPGKVYRIELSLQSNVPVAKGLKSSSAVSSASIQAVARAAGRELDAETVARLAADAGRRTGISATGAYDDALAGLRCGFVLTDNRKDRLISSAAADPSWTAVVLLPPGNHPPSPSQRHAFEAAAAEGDAAVREARAGRFATAMRLNTVLVERLMGYDFGELRGQLESAGAAAAGVSGLGPALGLLVRRERVGEVLDRLPTERGERFVAEFTRSTHA